MIYTNSGSRTERQKKVIYFYHDLNIAATAVDSYKAETG